MNDHASRAHSRYSASSASRWFACPGSVRLCEGVPETRSQYALEGTRAHEWLEALLHGETYRPAPEATTRDERKAMREAVGVAYDYVTDLLDYNEGAEMLVEQRFEIPSASAPRQVWGTNDVCVYTPLDKTLHVIDYKHGSGVAVEVEGNKQLRFYGVGALFAARPGWLVENVNLVIIQPRAFHPNGPIREERLSVVDLVDFSSDIDAHIAATLAPDAPLVPGVEQCRWCPAATICPARQQQALVALGSSFADVKQVSKDNLPEIGALAPDRIGQILAVKKLIVDWLDAVEDQGFKLAMEGVFIPGRKLVQPIGRRQWEGEPSAIAAKLKEVTGADGWFEPKLLGITEAEAKLKAAAKAKPGATKETIKAAVDAMALLTTKKASDKLSLVGDDDPRPAVDRAAGAFADVVALPHINISA